MEKQRRAAAPLAAYSPVHPAVSHSARSRPTHGIHIHQTTTLLLLLPRPGAPRGQSPRSRGGALNKRRKKGKESPSHKPKPKGVDPRHDATQGKGPLLRPSISESRFHPIPVRARVGANPKAIGARRTLRSSCFSFFSFYFPFFLPLSLFLPSPYVSSSRVRRRRQGKESGRHEKGRCIAPSCRAPPFLLLPLPAKPWLFSWGCKFAIPLCPEQRLRLIGVAPSTTGSQETLFQGDRHLLSPR